MEKTFEEMLTNLGQIFKKLRDVNLRLNKKKYHFFKRETEYLGQIVSEIFFLFFVILNIIYFF